MRESAAGPARARSLRRAQPRRAVLALPLALVAALARPGHAGAAGAEARLVPVTPEEAGGRALVEALRRGGLVLFFRHADTRG